jgi:hypothetical protein
MFSARSLIRSLPLVAAIVLAAAPSFADDPRGADAGEQGDKSDPLVNNQFPMPADKFQKLVDQRIERALHQLDQFMQRREVPKAKRAEVRKAADAAAARVRAAAARVTADGHVTKEEAKEVRDLARAEVSNLRHRYGRGHVRGH